MDRREAAALDRHITGNYGEDQYREDADDVEVPEPPPDWDLDPRDLPPGVKPPETAACDRLYQSDNGRVLCAEHADPPLAAAIARDPSAPAYWLRPGGTWSVLDAAVWAQITRPRRPRTRTPLERAYGLSTGPSAADYAAAMRRAYSCRVCGATPTRSAARH